MNELQLLITFILLFSIAFYSFTQSEANAKDVGYLKVHTVSWYGHPFHGRKTASGEVYNMYDYTAASNSHKMGTRLKVTNIANGKSVIVKVNDTGGFGKYGRTLDLSKAAFSSIANTTTGVIKVTIQHVK